MMMSHKGFGIASHTIDPGLPHHTTVLPLKLHASRSRKKQLNHPWNSCIVGRALAMQRLREREKKKRKEEKKQGENVAPNEQG